MYAGQAGLLLSPIGAIIVGIIDKLGGLIKQKDSLFKK